MRFSGAHILSCSTPRVKRVSRNSVFLATISRIIGFVSEDSTNRKVFWLLWTILSLAGYFLPFGWAIVEMFVALWLSWWIVYRSGLL